MTNVLEFIGRIFISALFLISAYNKVLNLEGSMAWMEGFGIPGFLIFPAIAVEIILPVLVIIGYQARLAAGILSIFCISLGAGASGAVSYTHLTLPTKA